MLVICHELFHSVWDKEILKHNRFSLLQVSELYNTQIFVLRYAKYMKTNLQVVDTKAHSIHYPQPIFHEAYTGSAERATFAYS